MKKIKIVLFTLVLSVMGVVGSINAVSINTSSKGTFSAVSRPIQSFSSNKNDSESSKDGKCILWSPKIQNFKRVIGLPFLFRMESMREIHIP